MISDPETRRWAYALVLVPLATVLVFLLLFGLPARSLSFNTPTDGSIVLSDVNLQQESGQFYLSASTEIVLPKPIKAGLEIGVPLDFVLTFKLWRPRRFWFDRQINSYEHRFRLTYYELTRHYRVYSVNTDLSRNFRSLSAALTGLGEFTRLPLMFQSGEQKADAPQQNGSIKGQGLRVVVDFKLDSKSLPLPLQPLIASSWQLGSEEYQWLFN